MALSKFIKNQFIPPRYLGEEFPPFYFHKMERNGQDIHLHYFIEGQGFGIPFSDKDAYDAFQQKFRVVSGHWAMGQGRWSIFERNVGRVILANAEEPRKTRAFTGKPGYSLKKGGLFSSKFTVNVFSPGLGQWEIKCKSFEPQKYAVEMFDLEKGTWVDGLAAMEEFNKQSE